MFPLIYITQRDITVRPEAADPSTSYISIDMDIVSRALHATLMYHADNTSVWHILHDVLQGHSSYMYICSYSVSQHGREAFEALILYFRGESRSSTVLKEAEDNINSIMYAEEKLKFTFDNFVTIHQSAHNDMLTRPGYVIPNDGTLVRKLLANIRSQNPIILASIANIKTSIISRNNF